MEERVACRCATNQNIIAHRRAIILRSPPFDNATGKRALVGVSTLGHARRTEANVPRTVRQAPHLGQYALADSDPGISRANGAPEADP
jgi:hypothetical protein